MFFYQFRKSWWSFGEVITDIILSFSDRGVSFSRLMFIDSIYTLLIALVAFIVQMQLIYILRYVLGPIKPHSFLGPGGGPLKFRQILSNLKCKNQMLEKWNEVKYCDPLSLMTFLLHFAMHKYVSSSDCITRSLLCKLNSKHCLDHRIQSHYLWRKAFGI